MLGAPSFWKNAPIAEKKEIKVPMYINIYTFLNIIQYTVFNNNSIDIFWEVLAIKLRKFNNEQRIKEAAVLI